MDIGTGRDVLAAGGRGAWRKGGEAGMQCEELRRGCLYVEPGRVMQIPAAGWVRCKQEHATCVDEFVALQVPDAVEDPPTDLTGMNVPESRDKSSGAPL